MLDLVPNLVLLLRHLIVVPEQVCIFLITTCLLSQACFFVHSQQFFISLFDAVFLPDDGVLFVFQEGDLVPDKFDLALQFFYFLLKQGCFLLFLFEPDFQQVVSFIQLRQF